MDRSPLKKATNKSYVLLSFNVLMKIEYMNGTLTYRKQKTEFMKIYLIEVE